MGSGMAVKPERRPRNAGPPVQDLVRQFEVHLTRSFEKESFVRLVLSSPSASASPVERVLGRLVTLRGESMLSLTFKEKTRDTTRNLGVKEVPGWLATELDGRFHAALLETTGQDWQLSVPADRVPRLTRHRARTRVPPVRTHDRSRVRPLDASASDWLEALRLVDSSGGIRPAAAAKYQQVMRYAELLTHLAQETPWAPDAPLTIADMGCGRGHLTFAAWQLFRRQLGLPAHVIGVETRGELVKAANDAARRLHLEGLEFVEGAISTCAMERLEVLVALHACNTATDDAILRGIELGARWILVAPCCHQELRPQLGRPAPFDGVLRHGLLAERFAEWLTDGLRALFLEWAGYHVKAIEFVAPEHTPKNLLLAAVRGEEQFRDPAVRDRILRLKDLFEIRHHALDRLLA